MSVRRFALIAGGGTGGHLVPALAVGRALQDDLPPGAVELVGSRRGLDAELLAEAGLAVTLLPGRGLSRRRDLEALVFNLGALVVLGVAFVRAVGMVANRRPAVVVAMGGYACVPVSLAALVWRVPVVLVNVDAVPGAANRLVARFAAAAAVAFEGTAVAGAVVTGAPVRHEVAAAAGADATVRRRARESLGVPGDRVVVAVVGGSLGSRTLNLATLDLARRWARRRDVALYHVVGRRDAESTAAARPVLGAEGLWYRQVTYEQHMAALYLSADVVVGRAGANTIAELAVVGVASVLVPLPGAPGDHQTANAAVLGSAGAAVVVPDAQCTGERLAAEIDSLLADPGRLPEMARRAAARGRPDAACRVVALVLAQARRAPRGPSSARPPQGRGWRRPTTRGRRRRHRRASDATSSPRTAHQHVPRDRP